MSYIDTKIIALTSQSATVKKNGTYLSNLRYEFGSYLKDDPDIIHRQIQLLNAQIPYSFYVINYSNQIFRYKLGVGAITSVNIPVGNYQANSLITAIKTAVNDVNFLITISSINGCLTFTYNTSFIIYNNFTYSIGSVLGFASNSTNNSVTNAITAPYLLNLLGIKTLQIRSNNLSCDNISSVEGGATILLSTIPVSAVPFGMVEYKDVGNNLISIANLTLDDLDIEIIDGETGNYINFNNQDWCITLALHITRRIPPIFTSPSFSNNSLLANKPKILNKNLEELNLLTQ
jgi:hypothetical protein